MTELVPLPTNVSQIRPQYTIVDERQIQKYVVQPKYQPWTPETSEIPLVSTTPTSSLSSEKAMTSCKKHLNTKFFMSMLVGLVICGVPLAVMSSLYVQKKNSSNGNATGNSGNNNVNLPSQCTLYTTNTDPTRLVTFTGCTDCTPDNSNYLPTGWYRFTNRAGTRLATMPANSGSCGASNPAWYNGTYPSTTGSTITTTVCVFYSGYICYPSYIASISITNCGNYFVFYLPTPTLSYVRYCTTF